MISFLSLIAVQSAVAASIAPMPFPVFLKFGFSSVLEFEDAPTRAVLGDSASFQIESLEKSVVIRPLVSSANTNMFVYFKTKPARLFVLTASDDAEPTFFKKFEPLALATQHSDTPVTPRKSNERSLRLLKTSFDSKKDFLTVDVELVADSTARISPIWKEATIACEGRVIKPFKVWSARASVERDTHVKARFIFRKPDLSTSLRNAQLNLPISNGIPTMNLNLGKAHL